MIEKTIEDAASIWHLYFHIISTSYHRRRLKQWIDMSFQQHWPREFYR